MTLFPLCKVVEMAAVVANTLDPVGYLQSVGSALSDVFSGALSVNGNYSPSYIQSQIEAEANALIKASGNTLDKSTAVSLASQDWASVPVGSNFTTTVIAILVLVLIVVLALKVL